MTSAGWPRGRSRDGGVDRIPLPTDNGALWLCGKHAIGPDPEGLLGRVGATTVVCLTERHELLDRYPDYVTWLDRHRGDRAVWFPIPDLHAATLDSVVPLIDHLHERIGRGEHLIVHCAAGIGRAGTMATCLLVAAGFELDEALRTVAEHRPMAGPEVGAQRVLVEAFAARTRVSATAPTIRDATGADLVAITDLTNALIPTTTVEYTDTLHTVDGRREWLTARRARGFPVIVAETPTEGVIGYASYGDFRDAQARPGYRRTVEHTVHVAEAWWGAGLGRVLMEELIGRARAQGLHVMVGAIDAENEGSIRFHERLGFVEVARMPQVGQKFGRWLDLVLVQLLLDDAPTP